MANPKPWSIKGIPREIRQIAKDAAAENNITMGEWVSQVIQQKSMGGGANNRLNPGETVVKNEEFTQNLLTRAQAMDRYVNEVIKSLEKRVQKLSERIGEIETTESEKDHIWEDQEHAL